MKTEPYSITLDKERHLVRVVARGEIRRELGHSIVSQSLITAAEHQYDILCDVRQAQIIATFTDWFFMPRTLAAFKDAKVRKVATALLIKPDEQENGFRFYETVVSNLGMKFKIFTAEKDALDWLSMLQ
jgi:hypothetical protein